MKNEYTKIRKILQKSGLAKNYSRQRKTIIAVLADVLVDSEQLPLEKYEIFCKAVENFSMSTWDVGLVGSYLNDLMTHGEKWDELPDDYKVKNLTWEDLLKPENDFDISEYLFECMNGRW